MAGIKLIDTAFPPEFPAASCTNIPQGAIWHNNSGIGHIYENLTFDHVWAGEFVNGLSYSVIRNNTVNDFGGIGLTGGTYSLMEGNVLTNGMSSIRGAGKYSVVRYNRIIDSNRSSAVYCGNHADGIGPLFSPAAEPGGNQYGWIYGNYISNTVQGIFLEYNNNGTSHWTMHSNVLVGHYGAGGSGACAICIDSAPDTKIYNNTIFGINGSQGWASGINIGYREGISIPSSNVRIKNNIMYSVSSNAPAIGVENVDYANGLISDYNWFYLPNRATPFAYGQSNFKTFSEWQGLGFDLSSFNGIDPKLIDIDGTDYNQINLQLSASSRARDAGESLAEVGVDLNDTSRPQGPAWDIGAYEYVQGEDTTPPSAPTGLNIN